MPEAERSHHDAERQAGGNCDHSFGTVLFTPLMRLATFIPIPLLLLGCSCSNTTEQPNPAVKKAPPPKIMLFYPGKAEVTAGESVQLCYGVDNTKAVRIEPLTEPIPPMFNKCIETTPKTTTVYTLVAEGADGATVRQAVTVRVGAARAVVAAGPAGPRLYDLVVTAMKVKAGNPWSFCFKASGAESVSASGGRFAKGANPAGDCLVDTPQKTTTYVITATGAGGVKSQEKVTVEVEP